MNKRSQFKRRLKLVPFYRDHVNHCAHRIKKREDNDDVGKFDAFLDERYGKITIVERQYDTSSSFKKVDLGSYYEELEKWRSYSE